MSINNYSLHLYNDNPSLNKQNTFLFVSTLIKLKHAKHSILTRALNHSRVPH